MTLPWWCDDFGGWAFSLACIFLVLALLVAVVETALTVWAKVKAAREGPAITGPERMKGLAAASVDPVKLLEALKALLDTLKALPAWVMIFLAGLALLWIAGTAPETCVPEQKSGQQNARQNNPQQRAQGNKNETKSDVGQNKSKKSD